MQEGIHPRPATLVLEDGTALSGFAAGSQAPVLGEVCFHTAPTGHQEILTDPSYAGQIVTFACAHVGNVGANREDDERGGPHKPQAAAGAIMRNAPTTASNWRAEEDFDAWLARSQISAIAGIDTRALIHKLRDKGAMKAVILPQARDAVSIPETVQRMKAWSGLVGQDWASLVTAPTAYPASERPWVIESGYGPVSGAGPKILALDCGTKRALLSRLVAAGLTVEGVPMTTDRESLLTSDAAGFFISNGPGDPAALAAFTEEIVRPLLNDGRPVFGVCLGHQLIASALGARTAKMEPGHHGANHPVQELGTGKVEIVSMNHEYAVERESLPESLVETHRSLFDGSNCGIRHGSAPIFAVQFHPEASPGPQDSFALFDRFARACGLS
jgi:carbamoyl-phosphate synthase small subunit